MTTDNTSQKNDSPPPVSAALTLHKVARIFFSLLLLGALIYLVIIRRDFFPTPQTFAPPPLTNLPIQIKESSKEQIIANNPHENVIVPPQKIDWKNTPITGAVPDAYAVIYRNEKAAGIVVDGEYIRLYQPIKTSIEPLPVGDYFVVAHELANNQLRLRISYPAIADAQKLLTEKKISETEYRAIAAAAAQKKIPAELNPAFGSPLYIAGEKSALPRAIILSDRALNELWLALPNGAVVMIR